MAPSPQPSPSPAPPAGTLSFSFAPMDPAAIQYIVALGAMGPPGHTLPTDHIYFYHHLNSGPFEPVPVTVPATGTIEGMLERPGDDKVSVRVNSRYVYYIDHVATTGLRVGSVVQAGTELGRSRGIAFDLSVVNEQRRLEFANPARYSRDTLFADAPLQYFEEPIRSRLYAKVQRTGADLDGRIDYDVAGTLRGNWFAEDLAPEQSGLGGNLFVGTRQLSFARDVRYPDRQRVSIGGLGMTGLWGVPPDALDFTTITPATGAVVYRLLELGEPDGPPGTRQFGLLIVQLIDDKRLRIEALPEQFARTATFSSNSQLYLR